ncbi:sialate O-acetylesterase [Granulicella pectinivorans]|uniref:Sialate O-acetylesterase n=1 Tax=Granulicella pectinivorans TaxID=474950 RepID=A0A1I6M0X8_9BACT|nr:sialate O-acetylesterase [Granulicella pectinivorans]SFS09360.1 sialate O-acetylesterase [Granulicella pectinivorans]
MNRLCLVAAGLFSMGVLSAAAEVKMPAIFGDHMVLQGGKTIPVWGMAAPGEAVTVTLGKDTKKTKADAAGKWRVDLKAEKASTAATTLLVKGTNELTFTDVLIGDVWVASGQSNMEFGVKGSSSSAAALASGNQPMIRLFTVPRATAAYPMSDIGPIKTEGVGKWWVCTPESLGYGVWNGFSAVAYFFGRDIQKFTGMPVGLIHTSWGGTPAEAWTPYDDLQKEPLLADVAANHAKLLAGYDAAMTSLPQSIADYKEKHAAWLADVKPGNDAALKAWQARVDATPVGEPLPVRPALVPEPQMPDPTGGPNHATALYNAMLAPIIPYGIKGAIWYQGESNAGRAVAYRTLFPLMIKSWREKWGEGDFPFLFVQLADFNAQWGMLREAQSKTLSVPHTGMAVITDVGTYKDIHPPFKEIVGDRLALAAEHVAYGKKLVYSGPVYTSMKVEGASVRLSFDSVGGGLAIVKRPVSGKDVVEAPDDVLVGFTVAGDDKIWHKAMAQIVGNDVVVTSADVTHPVAVRYGWDAPPVANLYNKEQLPASPFRTDDWEK